MYDAHRFFEQMVPPVLYGFIVENAANFKLSSPVLIDKLDRSYSEIVGDGCSSEPKCNLLKKDRPSQESVEEARKQAVEQLDLGGLERLQTHLHWLSRFSSERDLIEINFVPALDIPGRIVQYLCKCTWHCATVGSSRLSGLRDLNSRSRVHLSVVIAVTVSRNNSERR
ncbi:hypothetical protein TNCV_554901 [Trichonephila clavipes]|nr:hypothetical protein TNCV_554901 [Trichonephila clavipes]